MLARTEFYSIVVDTRDMTPLPRCGCTADFISEPGPFVYHVLLEVKSPVPLDLARLRHRLARVAVDGDGPAKDEGGVIMRPEHAATPTPYLRRAMEAITHRGRARCFGVDPGAPEGDRSIVGTEPAADEGSWRTRKGYL